MLTVIEQPTSQVLTGNPVLIAARCMDGDDNTIVWLGARSQLIFDGYFDLPTDDISLNWVEPSGLSLSVIFYAAASPDAPEEFPNSDSGYSSTIEYYEAIAEIMQAHPQVGPSFRVYAQDDGTGISLHVVARQYEEGWSVQWGDNNIVSGDTEVESSTELQTTAPDGYRVYCDVYMESAYGAGDYISVGALDTTPNAEGEVYFDISSVLHAGMLKSFTHTDAGPSLPTWDTDEPYIYDITRRFYVRLYELNTAADTDFQDIELLDNLHCIAGGIAQNLAASYDLLASLSVTNSFLTWKPDGRRLDTVQPEWIPWYNYTGDVAEIVLQVTEYDIESTPTVSYKFASTIYRSEIEAGQVVLIPISPRQLNLSDDTEYYTIRVVDGTSSYPTLPAYLSQARTYYVDRAYYQSLRYLQYQNTFFCPETLRCTGDYSVDVQISAAEAERPRPPGSSNEYAQYIPVQSEWSDRFTYRTGYLSHLEIHSLREVLIYRRLYEVNERVYIPLALQEGRSSFPIRSTRQNLHSIEIATRPAIRQDWYSNILIPIAPDGDAWLTDAGDYWETAYGTPWLTA